MFCVFKINSTSKMISYTSDIRVQTRDKQSLFPYDKHKTQSARMLAYPRKKIFSVIVFVLKSPLQFFFQN